jgi:hypothetical protein
MPVYSFMWQDNVFVTNILRHKKCKCCHDSISIRRDMTASMKEQRRLLHNSPTVCMNSSTAKHYIWDHTLYGPWAGIAQSV